MAITFIPGEVNKGKHSVTQGIWKSHHVIVYGSGNNLILSITSRLQGSPSLTEHLQTVYLETDPTAVDINDVNGNIAVAIKDRIFVYKPLNEYMAKPQWTHALVVVTSNNSHINCLKWGSLENELAVGTDDLLILYSVEDEFGRLKYSKRWEISQANPIEDLEITKNSNKIISIGRFDRLVKVWTRTNYGDNNSSFELSYLNHPVGKFVVDFKCRYKSSSDSCLELDQSMAKIKNMRRYIKSTPEDSGIVYTLCNDGVFRVWISYELSGHSHFKSWASIDLNTCFSSDKVAAVIILDDECMQKLFHSQSEAGEPHSEYYNILKRQHLENADIMLVISRGLEVQLYLISNITSSPPSNIIFEKLTTLSKRVRNENFISSSDSKSFKFDLQKEHLIEDSDIASLPFILKGQLDSTSSLDPSITLLIHDRMKSEMIFDSIDLSQLFTNSSEFIDIELMKKFDGQTKSIRKLVKSLSFSNTNSLLLSILNFSEYNYLWKPLITGNRSYKGITLSKPYKIDTRLKDAQNEGLWDGAVISDIHPEVSPGIHLVICMEKGGHISFWSCSPFNSSNSAVYVSRLKVEDDENHKVLSKPKAFIVTEFPKSEIHNREYCCIAIYESDLIKSWKIQIGCDESLKDTVIIPQVISHLPQTERIHQISKVDSFESSHGKNLVSIINSKGTVRVFKIDYNEVSQTIEWVNAFILHTNIRNASIIHGATVINKFAIVDETGFRLSIWDMKAGVLEYEEVFGETCGEIRDIDWTFVTLSNVKLTSNAILSIGFLKCVLLYSQLRYDYTNKVPTYASLKKIDISDYTAHEIGDLIWIDGIHLVIGSGNQFFIDDKWIKLESTSTNPLDSIIRQLVIGYSSEQSRYEESVNGNRKKVRSNYVCDIEQLVRALNGPLPVYHPQFLIQCLFMNQLNLVENILVRLYKQLRQGQGIEWDLGIDMTHEVLESDIKSHSKPRYTNGLSNKSYIFEDSSEKSLSSDLSVFDTFDDTLLGLLTESLMKTTLPLITRHQQITLITVISIVKELHHNLQSYDENAIRFMIGFRIFQSSSKQSRLTVRDMSWALHSEHKETLLSKVEEHYKLRFTWTNIKQVGLVFWIESKRLRGILESCARNEFSDQRDPSGRVSLFYVALRKKQILVNLWRTVTHPEKQKMLKFLNNDFTQQRWKSAALKNAFALMSKHRYVDAAYFFLLGDAVCDCCSVIASRLNDIQLAIAVAKVYDVSTETPEPKKALKRTIEESILPNILKDGDRWTTSWIFWEFDMKSVAIQALVKPPFDILKENKSHFSELCRRNYLDLPKVQTESKSFLKDDPALILLMQSLRDQTIKYFEGSQAITPNEEFAFIIKICSIYTRMGCDYLALILLRNWEFKKYDTNKKLSHRKSLTGKQFEGGNGTVTAPEQVTNEKSKERLSESSATMKAKPPPSIAFEEPDMSSFGF